MSTPKMPFKILALAPFKTTGLKPWDQAPIAIDKTRIPQAMEELGVAFYVPLPHDLCPAGGIDIRCFKPKDFHPDGMIQANEFLKNLADAGKFLAKKDNDSLDNLLSMVALPGDSDSSPPSCAKPSARIQASFRRIFGEIFSDDDFRRADAAWRGLLLLLNQGGVGGDVVVEIAPADMDTLEDTLQALTPVLLEDLPSLILVDLPFDNSARSIDLLESVASFSETLLVPSVGWITPKFFRLDSWDDLAKLPYLPHLIDEPNYARWRKLRGQSKANWLAVACNRFLTRYPYGPENRPRSTDFKEPFPPWTSPVWAIGALMGQSAARFGWPTRLSDWNEIRLQDLALFFPDGKNPMSTEFFLTEDRIQQFLRSGLTPLAGKRKQDIAFVPAETTVAGESLAYQTFLGCVAKFIIWCQDHLSRSLDSGELEQNLKQTLSRFFERGGYAGLESLEIRSGSPVEGDRIPLHISIKPVRRVLTSGREIQMDILW